MNQPIGDHALGLFDCPSNFDSRCRGGLSGGMTKRERHASAQWAARSPRKPSQSIKVNRPHVEDCAEVARAEAYVVGTADTDTLSRALAAGGGLGAGVQRLV